MTGWGGDSWHAVVVEVGIVVEGAMGPEDVTEMGGWLAWLPPLDDGSLTFAVITELTSVTWLFSLLSVLKPSVMKLYAI